MKKISSLLMVMLLVFSVYVPTYAANEIKILINEQYLEMDVTPAIINGRTLVPARAIVEKLGGSVNWNPESQQVTIVSNNTNIVLTLNESIALVDNDRVTLDVPAQLVESRTMIPLRFVAESLGVRVDFYNDTVIILTDINTDSIRSMEIIDGKLSTKIDNKPEVNEPITTKNITVTSPIKRNETAFLKFTGKPNTEYSISVFYSTVKSTAEGLENKVSSDNGNIEWSWKIGGKTNSGTFKIVISDGGESFETNITIVD